MESKFTNIVLVFIAVIVILMGVVTLTEKQITQDDIDDSIKAYVDGLNLSNIDEAQLVEDILAGLVFEDIDNEMIQDLWDNLNKAAIKELENEAEEVAYNELEDKNYELLEDYLKSTIPDFDEIEDVDVEDVEIKVLELGLNEDEDKSAEVVFELEVEYTLKTGIIQDYKIVIFATATINFEEGDFSEESVEFVFA